MMATSTIRITTLNIGRMNNLAGVFQLVKESHILLLQEVCMDEEQLTDMVRGRGYSVVISRGEGMLGVATLVHESLPDARIDNLVPGRLQQCQLGGYRILNVYAPAGTNLAPQRREFFSTSLLAACRKERLVIGGDYNSVVDPLDVEENFRNKRSIELRQIVQTFNLQDFYRVQNMQRITFTFNRPGSTSARLDRFYSSQDIQDGLVTHTPTLSDHMAVTLEVDFQLTVGRQERWQGRWKLNVSVLRDRNLRTHIQDLITNADLTDINQWEFLKETIVERLKEFSTLKNQFRRTTFQMVMWGLERALEEKNWEDVAHAKARIKDMVEHINHGYMIRARSSKEDAEEVATIYHATKEMKRGKQACLSKLKIGGVVEEDSATIKQEVRDYYQALYNGHHRTQNSCPL